MIQTINIQNVALIEKATLYFDNKLNVISGETGAGKSIMLDALSFGFGGRADRGLIRSGESKMKVEAIFTMLTNAQKQFVLNEVGVACEDELFLSRELDSAGKNVCKINGELVPLTAVKKICLMLVDVHGQSEHLALLNNDYQLQIVDLFSKSAESVLANLGAKIDELKAVENEIKTLGGTEAEKQNLIDLYTYQINEIENAKIGENEFENLTAEKKEMQQFEHINDCLKSCYEALSKNNFGEAAQNLIYSASKNLQQISELNPHYLELYNRLNSLSLELDDIAETVHDDLTNNVFDEQRFNFIDERLDYIKSLFRKYGGNYEKMQEYYAATSKKLDNLINSAEKHAKFTAQKQKLLGEIEKIQAKLTEIRKKSANELSSRIGEELKFLGMPNAKMSVEFSQISEPFSYSGADRVEFMFSANRGFELKPLNKVVSGGEMSRVMLAYKIVVGGVDNISTIVFDEIDTGLSGQIALTVAQYMAKLSVQKQIIAVSHLPQICAMADNNIKVEKFSDNLTTHTRAVKLEGTELVKEIARLMGAETNADGIKASTNLKQKCNEYKTQIKK